LARFYHVISHSRHASVDDTLYNPCNQSDTRECPTLHAGACDADARAEQTRADAEAAVGAAHEEAARAGAIADEAAQDAEDVGEELRRERQR
jgi:hypothetical protein